MAYFLTIGALFGLSAGFAPGPLLTLVISETLKHDIKSGVKVALAPVITDLPIIVATLYLLSKLSHFHGIIGVISLAGGGFVLFMGYESIRTKGVAPDIRETEPGSLLKGVLANALSPHPYLFWVSVGAPAMNRAMGLNLFAPLAFIVGFYTFLLGSKIAVAILVGRSRSFLSGKAYLYTMRSLGAALVVLAVVLFYDGLKLLSIIKV